MSPRHLRLCLLAGLGAVSFSALAQVPPSGAPTPLPPPGAATTGVTVPALPPDEPMSEIKLREAPLELVLDTLEMWTGRAVLRPQALPPATFTVTLPRMPKSEAITALQTLLSLNQIGIAPMGEKFWKVVPLQTVRTEAPELIDGSTFDLPTSGRVISKFFQLEFLRASEFVPQIANLLNPSISAPVMFEKSNVVLITDTVSTLQRIEHILLKIDRPIAVAMPKFYTITGGGKASDLVNKLHAMLQGAQQMQLGTATSYSPDDRTNQIVLLADPRQYPIFDELIARLDVKAEPNTRNEVIKLKNAVAKDVATILNNLVTGQNKAIQQGNGSSRPGQVVGTVPGQPNQPNQPPAPNQPPLPPSAMNALAEAAATNEFSGLITMQPDDRSNAIVVSGTVDDIRLIRELIDKVDVVLPQVRIEVVIAAVDLNDNDLSGIQALNLTFGQNGGVTRITNFDGILSGLKVSSGVVNPLSFLATLDNNGSKNNVKVLSAPTVVTTHNKEAVITVGQQYPYVSSSQTVTSGNAANPATGGTTSGLPGTSQVGYKDIVIELKVTPLIGDDGNIQLKIDQKVDDLVNTIPIQGLGDQPLIGHRQANSYVNVHDGNMIILGGLQQTKFSDTRTKLGFIWEIPGISQLFGKRTKAATRTELLLFIRPVIVRPEDGVTDTAKSINQLSNKEQVNNYLNPPPPAPPKKKKR